MSTKGNHTVELKKSRLGVINKEIIRKGLAMFKNDVFPEQSLRNFIAPMTNKQISLQFDVEMKPTYDYKKTVLNYLDKFIIAVINQATPAPPAPQDNGDVDADATLPTAPGSAAAAVAGDASVAGPYMVAVTPVRHPGGQGQASDGNPMPDVVTVPQLGGMVENLQFGMQQSLKQFNEQMSLGIQQSNEQLLQSVKQNSEQMQQSIMTMDSKLNSGLRDVGEKAERAQETAESAQETAESAKEVAISCKSEVDKLRGELLSVKQAMTPKNNDRLTDSKAPKSMFKRILGGWNDHSSDEENVSNHLDFDEGKSGDEFESLDI